MKKHTFKGQRPTVSSTAYLQEGVHLAGDVHVGERVSIWFNSTLRADVNKIDVGRNTNIQELSCLHVDEKYPTVIGENVTIGHGCIIHGCTIEKNVIVGMGSTLLSGVTIPHDCIVGAGSLVTTSSKLKANSLILGSPAKVVRRLTSAEVNSILESAQEYVKLACAHKNQ